MLYLRRKALNFEIIWCIVLEVLWLYEVERFIVERNQVGSGRKLISNSQMLQPSHSNKDKNLVNPNTVMVKGMIHTHIECLELFTSVNEDFLYSLVVIVSVKSLSLCTMYLVGY